MTASLQKTDAATQESQQRAITAFPAEPFIGKAETAKRLDCGARTLDTWMKRGLVPYYKISKKVVFKWSEVETAIKARCHVNRAGV